VVLRLVIIAFLSILLNALVAGQSSHDPQFIKVEVRGILHFENGHGYFVAVKSKRFDLQETRVWLLMSENKILARRLQSLLEKTVDVHGELEQLPANVSASTPSLGVYVRNFEIDAAPPIYPTIWFTPVNDPNKPDWEILPQEAKPGEVILSKRNELGLLSNFAPTPFVYRDKKYASLEGFWQMMLYPQGPDDPRARAKGIEWKYTREQVAQLTAFDAKAAGTLAEENMKKLGIDWCTFEGKRFPYRSSTPGEHYRLIVEATRAKVDQNPEVKRVLLATGDLRLKPDHHGEPDPPPEWKYYEILTQIRSDLQKPAPESVARP